MSVGLDHCPGGMEEHKQTVRTLDVLLGLVCDIYFGMLHSGI